MLSSTVDEDTESPSVGNISPFSSMLTPDLVRASSSQGFVIHSTWDERQREGEGRWCSHTCIRALEGNVRVERIVECLPVVLYTCCTMRANFWADGAWTDRGHELSLVEKTEKILTGGLCYWRLIFSRTFSKIPEYTASCSLFSVFKNLPNRRLIMKRVGKFPVSLKWKLLFKLPAGHCCAYPQVLVM